MRTRTRKMHAKHNKLMWLVAHSTSAHIKATQRKASEKLERDAKEQLVPHCSAPGSPTMARGAARTPKSIAETSHSTIAMKHGLMHGQATRHHANDAQRQEDADGARGASASKGNSKTTATTVSSCSAMIATDIRKTSNCPLRTQARRCTNNDVRLGIEATSSEERLGSNSETRTLSQNGYLHSHLHVSFNTASGTFENSPSDKWPLLEHAWNLST